MTWEALEHTGDVAIVVRSATPERLFEEAARAMFEILADLAAAEPREVEEFDLPGDAPDTLLRDFLAELLYKFSAEGRIYADFSVTLEPGRLRARVRGEAYDAARHPLRTELKAVTYHQLQVVRENDGWKAQVIFDV
jgi:SHS2 domain-containing protein